MIRSKTVSGYLARRGLSQGPEMASFLAPRLSELQSPEGMLDRDAAAERIAAAVDHSEEIVIFGDYDCDGMTATAILTGALKSLGGRPHAVLASRFDGGYGFSQSALERVLRMGPRLVITCDCGSSDHETLAELSRRGIDVVVVDHHLVPRRPLPAVAFLNPHRPGCDFPFKGMASCGLVFSLAAAVRQKLGRRLDLRPFLDLVAIGSIADVVPLVSDNRALVRAGLRRIQEPERPGIVALCEMLKLPRGEPVSASDVAFRIAPRLNAPGRLGAPDPALELLCETDLARARVLAARIEEMCSRRRQEQDEILEAALQDIRHGGFEEESGFVLGQKGWNHGIVGIVAGRLAQKYQKPVAVIGFDGEDGSGSVRGPAGFPLHDALTECREQLERFGGHQAACGISLKYSALQEFRAAFADACSRHSNYEPPVGEPPLELVPGDSLQHVLSDLYLLEPCGEGNPAPTLRVCGRLLSKRSVRGGHLKLEVELDGSGRLGVFAPSQADQLEKLDGEVILDGRLRKNFFLGETTIELLAERVAGP